MEVSPLYRGTELEGGTESATGIFPFDLDVFRTVFSLNWVRAKVIVYLDRPKLKYPRRDDDSKSRRNTVTVFPS